MGALIKSKNPRFELVPAIDPRPRRRDLALREILVREPRAFPEASTPPALPSTIPDEMLEGFSAARHDLRTVPARSRHAQTGRSTGDPRGNAVILNSFRS